MQDNSTQTNQNDKFVDKINDFVQRNRKGILVIIIFLVVGIA